MEDKHEKLAIRLANILICALNGERLDKASLANRFAVSTKTIGRDLDRLSQVLEETSQSGIYRVVGLSNKAWLDKDIDSLITSLGLNKAIPIRKRQFIDRILRDKKEQFFYFKEGSIEQNGYHDTFPLIEKAISLSRNVYFSYKGKGRLVSPYMMVFSNGIWYLAGVEDGLIKHFSFSRMKMISLHSSQYLYDHGVIDSIKETESVWSSKTYFDIVINVSEKVSYFFERRKILPYQKIIEKTQDGGLVIQAKACDFLQIAPIIQYWIPNIEIVSPSSLDRFIRENLRKHLEKTIQPNNL